MQVQLTSRTVKCSQVSLAFRTAKQEDCGYEISLGYKIRTYLEEKKKVNEKKTNSNSKTPRG